MGISINFLKDNVMSIAPDLTNVFNAIGKTGKLPNEWKDSFIIPIPKKGSPADVKNYRGISIQSCIRKLFDKLLTAKLQHHVQPLLPDQQHGFRQNRGTVTNLTETTHFIKNSIERDNQVDAVYVDFSKAFDKINHRIMAGKLAETGVPFTLFRAIMKFVIGRKHQLKVPGKQTQHTFTTRSSVPQGSHVGPVLFNLTTRKMITAIEVTSVIILMFASAMS